MLRALVFVAFLVVPKVFAVTANLEVGEFSAPKEVAFLAYTNEQACLSDNGKWRDEVCIVESADTVVIKERKNHYNLQIDTITTNAHMCGFEGKAVATGSHTLEARTIVEGEECTVKIIFLNDNTLDVSASDGCSAFCGMGATLNIEGAIRNSRK